LTFFSVVPTVFKQGTNQMIRFFVHGEIKNKFLEADKQKGINRDAYWYENFIAGGLAGAASVFGNTPIDVVKVYFFSSRFVLLGICL
jgi:solute carrier family 25 citrate transporter 1